MNALRQIDGFLFLFFNNTISNPVFDFIFPLVTNGKFWVVPGIGAAVFFIFKEKKQALIILGLAVATVALTDTNQEAVKGDRLIPDTVDIPLNFFPRAPSTVVDGRIISVVNGVTQIGQYQVVVINRGTNNGLSIGDVLTVFQTGEVVKDPVKGGKVKLPDEEAGTVMVFKTYDRISYGLVMEATQALHVLDSVRNPTR